MTPDRRNPRGFDCACVLDRAQRMVRSGGHRHMLTAGATTRYDLRCEGGPPFPAGSSTARGGAPWSSIRCATHAPRSRGVTDPCARVPSFISSRGWCLRGIRPAIVDVDRPRARRHGLGEVPLGAPCSVSLTLIWGGRRPLLSGVRRPKHVYIHMAFTDGVTRSSCDAAQRLEPPRTLQIGASSRQDRHTVDRSR